MGALLAAEALISVVPHTAIVYSTDTEPSLLANMVGVTIWRPRMTT